MSDSLKINLMILPEEGLRLTFSEGAPWFKECFSERELPGFLLVRADVNCVITKSGDTVYIRGELAAQVSQECGRCLEPAEIPIGVDFAYTLVPAKTETAEELELTAQELETSYYRGDFIDLAPIICEQIVLQVPMKIICADDCKGLCPHCGINLNTGSCSCNLHKVDNRLAVLKKFRVKN
ncbi:MAG: YceD family protein [Smithellaceae bacterium]